MPKFDVTKLDAELRGGTIRPLYVIHGSELHLMRTARDRITEAVLGTQDTSARRVFNGGDAAIGDVLDAVRAVQLFAGRTLVVLRDAGKLKKDALEALTSYAETPAEHATLMIEADKIDGRSRFMRTAEKHAAVIECKPLYASQIPSWVNIEANRQGKRISQEAARFLAEMVGTDLGQLSSAVERVALYVGQRPLIELADVEESVTETAQRTVFELGDAIGARRVDRALAVLENLIDAGQAPVFILNMIARHVRILIKAREVGGRLRDQQELARYLGVHPFFVKNYVSQAANFSADELRTFFRMLARCDRSIKSSRLPRERILEKLVIDLCGVRPRKNAMPVGHGVRSP